MCGYCDRAYSDYCIDHQYVCSSCDYGWENRYYDDDDEEDDESYYED